MAILVLHELNCVSQRRERRGGLGPIRNDDGIEEYDGIVSRVASGSKTLRSAPSTLPESHGQQLRHCSRAKQRLLRCGH